MSMWFSQYFLPRTPKPNCCQCGNLFGCPERGGCSSGAKQSPRPNLSRRRGTCFPVLHRNNRSISSKPWSIMWTHLDISHVRKQTENLSRLDMTSESVLSAKARDQKCAAVLVVFHTAGPNARYKTGKGTRSLLLPTAGSATSTSERCGRERCHLCHRKF